MDETREDRREGGAGPSGNGRRRKGFWGGAAGAALVFVAAASWGAYRAAAKAVDRELRRVLDPPALASPSLVYAQPLRFRPGLGWSPGEVEETLRELGYERRRGAPSPGTYDAAGPDVVCHLRALQLPERSRPPLRVTFRFDRRSASVAALLDGRGAALEEVETEPPPIGGFYGPRRLAREPVRLADVSPILRDAVLLVEDRRFYDHRGIDLKGIARALRADLRAGEAVQGGSTIPQQLAKRFFLHRRKELKRKALEAFYAVRMDALYPKSHLLETYLNEVFLGADRSLQISGVAEGARHYFGVDVRHVTLPQAALLAGLIRGPGNYDPFRRPAEARARRRVVLDQLLAAGRIRREERNAADAAPLGLRSSPRSGDTLAPAYVDALRVQLTRALPSRPLETSGFKIYTALDLVVQRAAQEALDRGLEELERRRRLDNGRLEGAIVVLEPQTGAVMALVGGRGGVPGTFNRAIQAKRQPGSLMKPLVYAAALAGRRFTPSSILVDEPIELPGRAGPWRPTNADGRYRGRVTLRRALEHSLNVPSVRLFQEVGPRAAIEVARRVGISSPLAIDYSVVLGTSEATPLEMAGAFAAFAAEGYATPPRFARVVVEPSGRLVPETWSTRTRAVDPSVAFILNQLLRGVCRRGTARALGGLAHRFPLSGKTGTTSGGRDAWFVGYTPTFLALVWVGPDDPENLGLSGAATALPIWRRLVAALPGFLDAPEPDAPLGAVKVRVDAMTGLRASRACLEAVDEWFLAGTEPRAFCAHRTTQPPSLPESEGVAEWSEELPSEE